MDVVLCALFKKKREMGLKPGLCIVAPECSALATMSQPQAETIGERQCDCQLSTLLYGEYMGPPKCSIDEKL
jgi:hypothetical protein